MSFPTVSVFVIKCSTGCSCCNSENHYRGPWSTQVAAEEAQRSFVEMKLLASQYAPNGRYYISRHDGELLPDGRVICAGRVLPGFLDLEESPNYCGDDIIGMYFD